MVVRWLGRYRRKEASIGDGSDWCRRDFGCTQRADRGSTRVARGHTTLVDWCGAVVAVSGLRGGSGGCSILVVVLVYCLWCGDLFRPRE